MTFVAKRHEPRYNQLTDNTHTIRNITHAEPRYNQLTDNTHTIRNITHDALLHREH